MTAQISERLRYEGQELSMCTNPLDDYFAMGGKNSGFQFNCTALWRGYVGSWEIDDGRLYLIGVSGTLENGAEASLASIFPEFPSRVYWTTWGRKEIRAGYVAVRGGTVGAHFLTVWKDVEDPTENAMNQRANNPAWLAKQAD